MPMTLIATARLSIILIQVDSWIRVICILYCIRLHQNRPTL